jgi:hypothetical protein
MTGTIKSPVSSMAGVKYAALSPPKKYSIQPDVSTRFMRGHWTPLLRQTDPSSARVRGRFSGKEANFSFTSGYRQGRMACQEKED